MADTGGRTSIRRTRTGCFKCRVRRRKCDEGKPSCRRCIDGGFACQYGTRLSFLAKNAKTIQELPKTAASSPEPPSSALRFVSELPAADASSPIRDPASTLPLNGGTPEYGVQALDASIENVHSHPGFGRPPGLGDTGPSSSNAALASPTASHPPARATAAAPVVHVEASEFSDSDFSTPTPTPGRFDIGISPREAAYASALHVPLHVPLYVSSSPGAGCYAPQEAASSLSNATQDDSGPRSPLSSRSPATPVRVRREACRDDGEHLEEYLEEFANCALLPQDRVIRITRQYRYNIAPWLDIGDPHQTFGLVISRIALRSTPVFESLLALSLVLLHHRATTTPTPTATPDWPEQSSTLYASPQQAESPGDRLLIVTFGMLRQFITTSPTSWQSPFKVVGLELLRSALSEMENPSIRLAVSWIILRLELSVGLMTGSSVVVPDALAYLAPSPASGLSCASLEFHREPLLLCAGVLNFCFGQQDYTAPPPSGAGMQRGGKTRSWRALFDSLNTWYDNRPHECKPMVELEETDQLFPLLLFTNGAALLANQIYHTSALLLLHCRPRTLPHAYQHAYGRSCITSPLWHAQRICGISLNNDSRQGWDVSLVASLYLAAKHMTYEPQQQAILAGIERIRSITKWHLGYLATQLRQEWQPV